MNPADFGMFWINQYAQAERMVMDENTSYYAQPSIGMSVLDDISHQTNSLVSYAHGDGPTNRRIFFLLFNFLRFEFYIYCWIGSFAPLKLHTS